MSELKRSFRFACSAALVVAAGTGSALAQGSAEEIRVTLGKSVVIDYPEDVNRISTSNPDVVDYVPVSTREILLHAKGIGNATLVIWAKSGQRNFYSVNVDFNLEPIRKMFRETFPNEQIQVVSARDSLSLVGTVSTPGVSEKAVALATPLAKSVVNNLKVKPAAVDKQILLRVKFAEMSRTAGSQFAVNVISTGAGNTIGGTTTGQFRSGSPGGNIGGGGSGAGSFSITDALNIFAFRPDLDLAAFVKLLQNEGVLQILAEPNLVTTNGQQASFLVGGEFPIPVLQGGSNAGAVTIQFREFGIRLTFTPTLTENSTLKMFVRPEVSTIDLANAVNFNGFTIPALATRRVESNIELAPGQSFVIGGLIDDRVNESLSRIPGLASIPLLGELFKSHNKSHSKSELIVMVTPEIVEALNPADPKNQPQMPGPFLHPMMLPNGMPGSSNVGAGTPANQLQPVTNRKDASKKGTASK
jgi:pilus assembly protein CpaC